MSTTQLARVPPPRPMPLSRRNEITIWATFLFESTSLANYLKEASRCMLLLSESREILSVEGSLQRMYSSDPNLYLKKNQREKAC